MTTILNIKDLHEKRKQKESKIIEAFNIILKEVYSKIQNKNNHNIYELVYTPPTIYFGYPLYDYRSLIVFLIKKLQKGGFKVFIDNNCKMKISWKLERNSEYNHEKSKQNIKKVTFKDQVAKEKPLNHNCGKLNRREIDKKLELLNDIRKKL